MPGAGPVALFTAALGGDGVSRNTIHLANALHRRGLPVEVICLTCGALSDQLAGPTVTRLGRPPGPRALALALAVPQLRRRLKTLRPSVALSMGNHAHLPFWAALRGLPDLPRFYRISNDTAHGAGPLREVGMRVIANDATRLVFVSSAIARRSAFRRIRRDGRALILPNGVDAEAVRSRAAASSQHPWISDGRPYVVSVGRLHPQKNHGRLVEALALARRREPDLRLLVVGAAPNRRRLKLQRLADALGVGAAVRFEGEVANPFPLLAHARAYALPSLWEGASNSLLEAVACGVPVVAARSAGNAAEVLDEGRFGVLVDGHDPADIAHGLIRQSGPDPVLPGDRAAAFSLAATTARLSAAIIGARSVHDEIQMLGESRGHVPGLSVSSKGRSKE